MSKNELTDNLVFLSALKMLDQLVLDGRLTGTEREAVQCELERKLRPTLLLT